MSLKNPSLSMGIRLPIAKCLIGEWCMDDVVRCRQMTTGCSRWRWCPEVPPVEALLVRELLSPQSGSRGDEDLMRGLAVDAARGDEDLVCGLAVDAARGYEDLMQGLAVDAARGDEDLNFSPSGRPVGIWFGRFSQFIESAEPTTNPYGFLVVKQAEKN
uniref:Uncharacterized protein n=1 Tax=Vitis vinifera TaxID=29760 RepID=A5B0C7_VITVI|nr:hypothetical protein VITISV_015833 [Vitis vinifera]